MSSKQAAHQMVRNGRAVRNGVHSAKFIRDMVEISVNGKSVFRVTPNDFVDIYPDLRWQIAG